MREKAIFFYLIFFILMYILQGDEVFQLEKICGEKKDFLLIRVFKTNSSLLFKIFENNIIKQEACYSPEFLPRYTIHFKNRMPVAHVSYDFKNRHIKVEKKGGKKHYDILQIALDQNLSLFFVLGKYFKYSKYRSYYLLQIENDLYIEMYFKKIGDELININNREILTEKYESGVDSLFLRIFWPYKYFYWYDKKNTEFVKYQGFNWDKNKETIILVNHFVK